MKQQSKRLLLFLAMFFCVALVTAQERQVSGTVKDANGNPLSNASYLIKGTQTGGVTDEEGHFSIQVNGPKTILVFSSVNFKPKEITVGQNSNLEVTLESDASTMQEVVVTALGIKKEKKSLGYSVQEVKGETLVSAKEPNLVNDLSGQVAG